MGNLGRYACVAIPFLMTLASLAALLVGGLGGVTDKNLFLFQVNTTNVTISAADVSDILKLVTRADLSHAIAARGVGFHDTSLLTNTDTNTGSKSTDTTTSQSSSGGVDFHDPTLLGGTTTGSGSKQNENKQGASSSAAVVTGADLGLATLYDIGLWGYCYTSNNGTRDCTKPAFNWAENALNKTASNVTGIITATGKNVTLPKEVVDSIQAFQTASKWTEIVFIIAAILLAVEIFFGLLANCSRVFGCITWIVAGFATTAVCAFAALSTATSAIVIGVLEGSAKKYGVTGSFNTRFLATVWISAAFAIAAGMFWIFTCCCCAPDHSSRRSSRNRDSFNDREKLVPAGAYVPIHGDHGYNGAYGSQQHHYATSANPTQQRNIAYEPYAQHHNV